MDTPPITIIVADDQHLFRQGLISLLKEFPNYKVIGEAVNGKDLLSLLKKSLPHIILLDLDMPVMDGQQALSQIRILFPEVKVIIVSNHDESHYIADCVIKGAHGYLPKNMEIDDLKKAIHAVMNDKFFFDNEITNIVIPSLIKSAQNFFEYLNLSPIEISIIVYICEEKENREIAALLNKTENSIKFHRKRILKKTGIKSVVGLVKFAIKYGINGI